MGLTSVVLWWEEWQLLILVLGNLFIQWLLLLSASLRKPAIPSKFRSIIRLVYLWSDALDIYALAILFDRERRQGCNSGQCSSILEVVWVPILLVHLDWQDAITAYNIETSLIHHGGLASRKCCALKIEIKEVLIFLWESSTGLEVADV